jgi:hypothetical protein
VWAIGGDTGGDGDAPWSTAGDTRNAESGDASDAGGHVHANGVARDYGSCAGIGDADSGEVSGTAPGSGGRDGRDAVEEDVEQEVVFAGLGLAVGVPHAVEGEDHAEEEVGNDGGIERAHFPCGHSALEEGL